MSDHVPLPPTLRVPPRYRYVQDYLVQFDGDLRLRRSAERPDLFVLERRVRNQPAVNTGMANLSDMHVQARDGYVHISTVHPQWLERPWLIVRALREEGADLWDTGGAGRIADECDYEEQWQRITRRRRRQALFRDIAVDGYDLLNRVAGSGRSRINNAGGRHGRKTITEVMTGESPVRS